MITVKLEHTPMHKTVAELAEIFKPPPPPTRANNAARKDRQSNKRKATADNGGENGEDGAKKKRKKKTANPDDPTAADQTPKAKKPRALKPKKKGDTAQITEDAPDDAMLNLSPSEAARRRDEATRKLSESGIDPSTLSEEQFDIFANQSPELQNESLAMLIKYGAERLRIVHPNKDSSSSSPAQAATGSPSDGLGKKKKSHKKQFNDDGTPRVKKTRGNCQACRAKKTKVRELLWRIPFKVLKLTIPKCSKAKPECNECVQAGIECYYPPEQKRKPINKSTDVAQDDRTDELVNAPEAAIAGPVLPQEPAPVPADAYATEPVGMPMPEPEPEPQPETIPDEEASDLGSPGFNSSHPAPPADTQQQTHAPHFHDNSHDMYQPSTGGLSYPQDVPNEMPPAMDYSAYSSQLGQQQATQSGLVNPQQSQQTSNLPYAEQPSANPAPAPEAVQTVQTPAQPSRSKSSRSRARRSLPSGTRQDQSGYSTPANVGNGSDWQAANPPVAAAQTHTASTSPRQSRAGRQSAVPLPAHVYGTSQQEALAAAATLSQAALQKTQPSPTTRTVSPFQNATQAAAQAARAKSRQGQRAQSRTTASPFQQAPSTQPVAVDTATMYNPPSTSTEPNNLPNYDQYSRYNMTTTNQNGQASSRRTFDSYSQQADSNNLSASYPGYDAYNARSQTSTTTPHAAPAAQAIPTSYTNTPAASAGSWSNSKGHRNSDSYGSNNPAVSAKSTYTTPAPATQQQPSNMQAFNVRPQSSAHASRTSTPTSYNAQQRRTQQRTQHQQQQQQPQPQQPYNSYSAPSQSSTAPQPSQQQQDWYGFGAGSNANTEYGSNSRGAGYAQSTQHRPAAMNISGNTYQSMGDQDLYDMFRAPPAH